MNHFRVSPIFPFWNLEERHMILNVWVVIVWCLNEYTQRDPFYMRIAAHSTHPSPFSRTTFALFPIKVYYRTRWGKIPRPSIVILKYHGGEDKLHKTNNTHVQMFQSSTRTFTYDSKTGNL